MVEKEIASNLDKEPPSSIKTVKEMLQGNSFPESNTAITAIPELYPDSQAKQMLLGIWNSVPSNSYDIDSVSLKMNSAVQLWSLGEKKYLPFVFEQIEHGNLTLKTRGIDLLSNVNSEKSRNVLREVIKNNNEIPMVIFAIKSLGEIGKSKDIALLDKVKAKNIQGMNEPIENAKSSINERITIKK